MLRVAFWAFNIWSAKKGLDLLKENTELKSKASDDKATIRTLTGLVNDVSPSPSESDQDSEPHL